MTLLAVEDLSVRYVAARGPVQALDRISLSLEAAEIVGLVGESGSGKSTLGLALPRLLPAGTEIAAARLDLAGRAVLAADDPEIRRLRRETIGIVFQNPLAILDPTMRIGRQVARAIGAGRDRAAVERALARAQLADPARVAAAYPHQLSGGMAQRVAIAMTVARRPRLIVADEPTAALDASLRGEILDLLAAQRDEGAGILLLTHDLHTVARRCGRVAVMYGGRIVEEGPSDAVFGRPAHPYTRALLEAAPGREAPDAVLSAIPGLPPTLSAPAAACAFAPRCALAAEACRTVRPEPRTLAGRRVVCHRAEEVLAA
jgi:oligopeptide/dipeptide ABC transporter ATP-binding protein